MRENIVESYIAFQAEQVIFQLADDCQFQGPVSIPLTVKKSVSEQHLLLHALAKLQYDDAD